MSESLFVVVTVVLVVAFWLCWNRHEIFGVKGCDCSVCKNRREKAAAEEAENAAYWKEKKAAEKFAALSSRDRKLHRLINHAAFNQHLATALGEDADPAVLRALNLALAGALLQAGMGYFSYGDPADRMDEVAGLLLGGSGR
jgi:hypothetical protein